MIAGNKHITDEYRHGCHSAKNLRQPAATVIERDGWHPDGRARMVERPATRWDYAGCCFARDGYAAKDRACDGCVKLEIEK